MFMTGGCCNAGETEAVTQSECTEKTGGWMFCSKLLGSCRRVSNFGLIDGGIHESEGGHTNTPGLLPKPQCDHKDGTPTSFQSIC